MTWIEFWNGPWDGFWNEFWLAGTTIGTLALALASFRATRQAANENKSNERHHRDQFRPICILENVSGETTRTRIYEKMGYFNSGEVLDLNIKALARIRNIGAGVAINLSMELRYISMSSEVNVPRTKK